MRPEGVVFMLGVGFMDGMPETESVRRLLGLKLVIITSSGRVTGRLLRDCVCRWPRVTGEFSFLFGVPRREVGAGMLDCFVGEGVRGETLICRLDALGGVCGDQEGVLACDVCRLFRSERELRRFFLGGPVEVGTSPIVSRPEPRKVRLGVDRGSSNGKAPRTVCRSREEGRLGEMRPSMSVDFVLLKEAAFETLPG